MFKLVTSLLKPNHESLYPESPMNDLPNEFGCYFGSKIEKIRHELDQLEFPSDNFRYTSQSTAQSFESFTKLSEDDVRKLIFQSPSKHCVNDPLPTWLLKECVEEILPFVTLLINMSLQQGHFPLLWKNAIVTPILKKVGADIIFSNYRPVSNLPFLSKLVERAVVKQLSAHMAINNVLPANQSAYRQFHSTETT